MNLFSTWNYFSTQDNIAVVEMRGPQNTFTSQTSAVYNSLYYIPKYKWKYVDSGQGSR